MSQAKRVILASRPVGEPKASDFGIEEYALPSPGQGQVLRLQASDAANGIVYRIRLYRYR